MGKGGGGCTKVCRLAGGGVMFTHKRGSYGPQSTNNLSAVCSGEKHVFRVTLSLFSQCFDTRHDYIDIERIRLSSET